MATWRARHQRQEWAVGAGLPVLGTKSAECSGLSFYFYYFTFTLLLLRSAPYPDSNGATAGQPEQQRDHSGTTSAGQPKQQRDTSGTTVGQPRDNLGTPRERTSQAHTHIVFPQLLSLHDLADNNFNLCSTLSASSQPLTPVSMPAPLQDAARGCGRQSTERRRSAPEPVP